MPSGTTSNPSGTQPQRRGRGRGRARGRGQSNTTILHENGSAEINFQAESMSFVHSSFSID